MSAAFRAVVAAMWLVPGLALASGLPARPTEQPQPLCEEAVDQIDASVARTLAQGSPGMVVGISRHGRPLFVRGYGVANLEHGAPVTPVSVFKLASVTKQFTAAAVLLLAEDGSLRLEDSVSRFVPELRQADRVTLYQLLVQTSGLPDYAEDPAGEATKSVNRTLEEMVEWIGRLEPEFAFEPGTSWRYSNSNYMVLGLVVERASGIGLWDFFERRLFGPAGLVDTAFDNPADVVPHRAQGYRRAKDAPGGFANADWISPTMPGPAGGLRTTVEDLARWSDALFAGRVLSPASVETMVSAGLMNDGRTTKYGMPEAWQKGLDSDYGMGVFLASRDGRRRVWHSGNIDGFASWLSHYPGSGITIALMENSQSADMDSEAIEAAVFAGVTPGSAWPYCTQGPSAR
jgi:D-alanyl-D-alanine carboxypeptidase